MGKFTDHRLVKRRRKDSVPGRPWRLVARDSRGSMLVETVIAMMVFTAVGTAVLTGLSISLRTGEDTERKAISEGLSRTEMEYIASLAYENPPVDYAISPSIVLPPGYAITATGSEENAGDQNLQRIVVVVSFGGVDTLRLETFRTKVN